MKKIIFILFILFFPSIINANEYEYLEYLEKDKCDYKIDLNDYKKEKLFDRRFIDEEYLNNYPNVIAESNPKYIDYNNQGLNYIYFNNIKLKDKKSIIVRNLKVYIKDEEINYNLYKNSKCDSVGNFISKHEDLVVHDGGSFSISLYKTFNEKDIVIKYTIDYVSNIESMELEFRYDYLSPIFSKKYNSLENTSLKYDSTYNFTNKIVVENYSYYKMYYKCYLEKEEEEKIESLPLFPAEVIDEPLNNLILQKEKTIPLHNLDNKEQKKLKREKVSNKNKTSKKNKISKKEKNKIKKKI